jgi:hypothetical protein
MNEYTGAHLISSDYHCHVSIPGVEQKIRVISVKATDATWPSTSSPFHLVIAVEHGLPKELAEQTATLTFTEKTWSHEKKEQTQKRKLVSEFDTVKPHLGDPTYLTTNPWTFYTLKAEGHCPKRALLNTGSHVYPKGLLTDTIKSILENAGLKAEEYILALTKAKSINIDMFVQDNTSYWDRLKYLFIEYGIIAFFNENGKLVITDDLATFKQAELSGVVPLQEQHQWHHVPAGIVNLQTEYKDSDDQIICQSHDARTPLKQTTGKAGKGKQISTVNIAWPASNTECKRIADTMLTATKNQNTPVSGRTYALPPALGAEITLDTKNEGCYGEINHVLVTHVVYRWTMFATDIAHIDQGLMSVVGQLPRITSFVPGQTAIDYRGHVTGRISSFNGQGESKLLPIAMPKLHPAYTGSLLAVTVDAGGNADGKNRTQVKEGQLAVHFVIDSSSTHFVTMADLASFGNAIPQAGKIFTVEMKAYNQLLTFAEKTSPDTNIRVSQNSDDKEQSNVTIDDGAIKVRVPKQKAGFGIVGSDLAFVAKQGAIKQSAKAVTTTATGSVTIKAKNATVEATKISLESTQTSLSSTITKGKGPLNWGSLSAMAPPGKTPVPPTNILDEGIEVG